MEKSWVDHDWSSSLIWYSMLLLFLRVAKFTSNEIPSASQQWKPNLINVSRAMGFKLQNYSYKTAQRVVNIYGMVVCQCCGYGFSVWFQKGWLWSDVDKLTCVPLLSLFLTHTWKSLMWYVRERNFHNKNAPGLSLLSTHLVFDSFLGEQLLLSIVSVLQLRSSDSVGLDVWH